MKKTASVMLIMVLIISAFSACGNTKNESSSTESKASSTGSTSGAETSGTTSTGNGQEAVKIIWQQIGTQPGNLAEVVEKMNAYTREKIGVEVDLRFFDWGEYETGINNMLNTGEYYDIAFVNTKIFTGHAQQGKFLDLTDLLSQTPGLTDLIPENVWKGVTIKGQIAGVPTYKDSAATQYAAFDKAIVEKYNIDLSAIKDLKDLDSILRTIKEGEEKETGETVYPLPLSKEGVASFMTVYDNNVRYDDATATVSNIYEDAALTEDFALVHKWWEDGIVNPDASTKDDNDKYRICFVYQGFEGSNLTLSADRGYDIVHTPITDTIFSTESIQGSINSISANSKYPTEALKYLELVNTDPVLRNMYAYGMPDSDFEDNGDGTITRLSDTWTAAAYSQATFFTLSPVAPNPADQWTKVEEQNKSAVAHTILGFTLDDSAISTEWANVNAVIEKYKAELRSGAYQGTTEAFLQKMNDEMKAAGLETVLEETQKQVNEFLGK